MFQFTTSSITSTDPLGHTFITPTVFGTPLPAGVTPTPRFVTTSNTMSSPSSNTQLTASDAFFHEDVWNDPNPTIGCMPPCCVGSTTRSVSGSASSQTLIWPVHKTSFLSFEGSSTLVPVNTTSVDPWGQQYTLCSKSGARPKIKPTWITLPPFTAPPVKCPRICQISLEYPPDSNFGIDSCGIASVKPPIRSMSLNPGELWIRSIRKNEEDNDKKWAVGVCTNTTVKIWPEPTVALPYSVPKITMVNKSAGKTCFPGTPSCGTLEKRDASENHDEDGLAFGFFNIFRFCKKGLLGRSFWPFKELP
jgi:hypothetical protein